MPYNFLFKPNNKRVKPLTQKEEERERKYKFLIDGYPQNYTYTIGDFNPFANQKIK